MGANECILRDILCNLLVAYDTVYIVQHRLMDSVEQLGKGFTIAVVSAPGQRDQNFIRATRRLHDLVSPVERAGPPVCDRPDGIILTRL